MNPFDQQSDVSYFEALSKQLTAIMYQFSVIRVHEIWHMRQKFGPDTRAKFITISSILADDIVVVGYNPSLGPVSTNESDRIFNSLFWSFNSRMLSTSPNTMYVDNVNGATSESKITHDVISNQRIAVCCKSPDELRSRLNPSDYTEAIRKSTLVKRALRQLCRMNWDKASHALDLYWKNQVFNQVIETTFQLTGTYTDGIAQWYFVNVFAPHHRNLIDQAQTGQHTLPKQDDNIHHTITQQPDTLTISTTGGRVINPCGSAYDGKAVFYGDLAGAMKYIENSAAKQCLGTLIFQAKSLHLPLDLEAYVGLSKISNNRDLYDVTVLDRALPISLSIRWIPIANDPLEGTANVVFKVLNFQHVAGIHPINATQLFDQLKKIKKVDH